MTRQQARIKATVTMIFATLSVLALSAGTASADYRAWYAPWDYVGDFQPGDISDDFSKMIPPAGACGLRISDPSYYRWVDDNDGTITSHDLYKDVIIWIDSPGCSRPFSTRYYDDSHTFTPPSGGVSIEISTNYNSYWVNDNGYYLYTCGNCVGADDFTVAPPDDSWSLPEAAAIAGVSASLVDSRRQSRAVGAIAGLSRQVVDLQAVLQRRIADRRRTPLGGLEAVVRSLEDAAARSLAAARTSTATCETRARQGVYDDSFVACTTAGRQVEESRSRMLVAWSFVAQAARLQQTGSPQK